MCETRLSVPFRNLLRVVAFLLAVAVGACSVCAASERSLEGQLLNHAPQVLDKLRSQGCKTVGVLKFRVQKAGEAADDNAGTLNTLIAARLEAALAIKNPDEPEEQIQIVRDASRIAASIPGATHLSREGRKLLFHAQYPLAWGNRRVTVDRFVTGVVQLAADKRSLRVGIFAVSAERPEFKLLLPPFEVATNGEILHELGESFQLRGDGEGEMDPASSARQVSQDPRANFPLRNRPAVILRIRYDSDPVDVEIRDGKAWIPEPQEGQTVTMELERTDSGQQALGAVLKVNGENTLYRERLREIDCQKWVLRPGWLKTTIRGYQFDDEQTESFRVSSREESRGSEMYYGPDVGTISLAVFEEAPQESETGLPMLEKQEVPGEDHVTIDEIAVAKAQFPDKPASDAKQLKALLRPVTGRGLIERGEKVVNPVTTEEYVWSPELVLSAVIHYYRPAKVTQ